jgi:hypothetical protein
VRVIANVPHLKKRCKVFSVSYLSNFISGRMTLADDVDLEEHIMGKVRATALENCEKTITVYCNGRIFTYLRFFLSFAR